MVVEKTTGEHGRSLFKLICCPNRTFCRGLVCPFWHSFVVYFELHFFYLRSSFYVHFFLPLLGFPVIEDTVWIRTREVPFVRYTNDDIISFVVCVTTYIFVKVYINLIGIRSLILRLIKSKSFCSLDNSKSL